MDIENSGSVVTSTVNTNDTGNATFDVVPAVAGKRIRLHKFLVSLASADTITVKFGSTTILGPIYCGANGGFVYDCFPQRFRSAEGEALTITKGSAGTDVTAQAFYTQD